MKNETGKAYTNRNQYYIDGNTVRRTQAETMPDYRRERQERIRREKQEELRRKQKIARRKQEKALRVSRSYVTFLTMAVIVFGVVAGTYINIQSDITARMNRIASLESQIENLKADNDEAYKRISTTVDLESVKMTAMSELGMSYAKESQIVYYSVGDDDYMNQYSEIPTK